MQSAKYINVIADSEGAYVVAAPSFTFTPNRASKFNNGIFSQFLIGYEKGTIPICSNHESVASFCTFSLTSYFFALTDSDGKRSPRITPLRREDDEDEEDGRGCGEKSGEPRHVCSRVGHFSRRRSVHLLVLVLKSQLQFDPYAVVFAPSERNRE